jgi:anti-sigma factor RsiW
MDSPRAELEDDRSLGETLAALSASNSEPPSCNVPRVTQQITCRRFVELLSAWHDGELAEGAHASFDTHRAGCARCAHYAWAFQAAIALIKSALARSGLYAELPEDLTQAILTACRETN